MGSDVFGDEVEHHKVLDNVKSHKKKKRQEVNEHE